MRTRAWLVLLAGSLACPSEHTEPAPSKSTSGTAAQHLLQNVAQPGGSAGTKLTDRLIQQSEAPPISASEEARRLAELDLGAREDLFPTELQGVKLGMTLDDLLQLRPGVRLAEPQQAVQAKPKGGRIVLREIAPAANPFERFRYHFVDGKLVACFAVLKLSRLSDKLLDKAVRKWGTPRTDSAAKRLEKYHRLRGGRLKMWRFARARVKLERARYDSRVRIYIARR